jgi:transcriptional regulator
MCFRRRISHAIAAVRSASSAVFQPARQNGGLKMPALSREFSLGHSKGAVVRFYAMAKGETVGTDKSEVLQGTLDLMILKTLHALGPLHGFGIARRIEQVSENVLTLNEGTVYTSLLRLQQQGWIEAEWGTSENNRRARFYSITRIGRKQLAIEMENWERISGVIGRVLRLEGK